MGVIGYWRAGLAAAGLIIAVVAALLLAIIATARNILATAERALAIANEIVENTRPIWQLDQTNAVAMQLQEGAEAIERHASEVADTLDAPRPTTR